MRQLATALREDTDGVCNIIRGATSSIFLTNAGGIVSYIGCQPRPFRRSGGNFDRYSFKVITSDNVECRPVLEPFRAYVCVCLQVVYQEVKMMGHVSAWWLNVHVLHCTAETIQYSWMPFHTVDRSAC